MSIELKIHNQERKLIVKTKLNKSKKSIENYNINKKQIMLDQKYKIDAIDGFGANTSDLLDNPVNFITKNNYLIYNIGHHILIKDISIQENELFDQPNNNFIIYLSPKSKKITSMSVSNDKSRFVICEELEENSKNYKEYSTISLYEFSKLNMYIYDVLEPVRKIITNVYYNFKSANLSNSNYYLCAVCSLRNSDNKTLLGIVYDMKEYNDFKMNETQPYITFDLINTNNNINIDNILVNKISFDYNKFNMVLCTSGNNNLNFWYIYSEGTNINFATKKYKEINCHICKNKNYVDHYFYKSKESYELNNKIIPILITISSINELFIIQGTQKNLDLYYKKTNNESSEGEGGDTPEINILNTQLGYEQFEIKFYIANIFNDNSCFSSKFAIIQNDKSNFDGLIIGNNSGDIVFYEKIKKDFFEYKFIQKFSISKQFKCTSLSLNYNQSLLCITHENNQIIYCDLEKNLKKIKKNNFDFINLCGGFNYKPISNISMSIQSPIIVASSPIDKSLKIWNYISGYSLICPIVLPDTKDHYLKNFKILSFAMHPNGYYLAISNEDMIWFFHICYKQLNFYGNEISKENKNKKYNFEKRSNCHILKFSHGGHKLAAANSRKNIFIISTFSREVINFFHMNHIANINDIIFSDDDIYLYSFGADGAIYEINLITEDTERIISTTINITRGFFYTSYSEKKNIWKEKNDPIKKYYNIIACGYDLKNKYYIIEVCYIPNNENNDSGNEQIILINDMTFIKDEITCMLAILPKKIEKKCIVCGTKNGKIIIYPCPFKDADCKYDEIQTHTSQINQLIYNQELNMIISCGDDGNIFIYSIYEILGETTLYDNKKSDDIFEFNSTLDITLGNRVLFPINELEKIEIGRNEEKEILDRFEEEKDKISMDHKINLEKLIKQTVKKYETEKKTNENKITSLQNELNNNKQQYDIEMQNQNKELSQQLEENIKLNSNKLYQYQTEIKNLKEKLKIVQESSEKAIKNKEKDYEKKFLELKNALDSKIKNQEKKNSEILEKFSEVQKEETSFARNIERENIIENDLLKDQQNKKNNEYKFIKGHLNYDIIKYRDIVEKLQKRIKDKNETIDNLLQKIKYLETMINKYRDDNLELVYDKEIVTDKFQNLQQIVQNKEIYENFSNKLRVELYRQNFELSSKYHEKTVENEIYQKKSKKLQKNVMNVINEVFGYEKERTKALTNLEIEKKENGRLHHEFNLAKEKFDKIIHQIYQSFQTHNKNDILKCICDIYKKYVTEDFKDDIQNKLLDKKIILELESQINTIEEQININSSKVKKLEDNHEQFKEKNIILNSSLIDQYKNNKMQELKLTKSINKLKGYSKILNNQIRNIRNNSTIRSSNNESKDLNKNSSNSLSDIFRSNELYKNKNTSTILPSSIIKQDSDEVNNLSSKKGSLFFGNNDSKKFSDILGGDI